MEGKSITLQEPRGIAHGENASSHGDWRSEESHFVAPGVNSANSRLQRKELRARERTNRGVAAPRTATEGLPDGGSHGAAGRARAGAWRLVTEDGALRRVFEARAQRTCGKDTSGLGADVFFVSVLMLLCKYGERVKEGRVRMSQEALG